jgi:hypothetical protein
LWDDISGQTRRPEARLGSILLEVVQSKKANSITRRFDAEMVTGRFAV